MDEKRMREQKERMERVERPNALRAATLSQRLDALKAESAALRSQIAQIDEQVGGPSKFESLRGVDSPGL